MIQETNQRQVRKMGSEQALIENLSGVFNVSPKFVVMLAKNYGLENVKDFLTEAMARVEVSEWN